MANPIRTLVRDYKWIHLSLGLSGNVMFFVGSVLFLPLFEKVAVPATWFFQKWQTFGVWLFVFGSFFMMVGALGNLLVSLYESE